MTLREKLHELNNEVTFEQAAELYSMVPGYCVENGCICKLTKDGAKALTDFVAIPRAELIRDDGVYTSTWYVIDGWDSSGRRLRSALVSAKELDAMRWVTDQWGMFGVVPGPGNKDKVAWAIKKVGQMTAKRVTEYIHTGWRRIDGRWCYLYHGGAVGQDGAVVDMGDALSMYRLDGSGADGFDDMPWLEACMWSEKLQYVMSPELGVALMGTIYLAPLREFMFQAGVAPAYALFLNGRTQTRKTTAATLALSHFGIFNAKRVPASFNDTYCSIIQRAFLLKDMPLLIDDYHTVSNPQEMSRMRKAAQLLSRAFGDGCGRGRMNTDHTVRPGITPRCTAIMTGDYVPEIGESGQARFYVVNVNECDVPFGPELTQMQDAARRGWLQRAMLGYIEWLAKQADKLPELLRDSFLTIRRVCIETDGLRGRAPEAVACILTGYQTMLYYFRDAGLFDAETARQKLLNAHRALVRMEKAW